MIKQVEIKQIELLITTRCTLICKHCSHLIPYYRIVGNGTDESHRDMNEIVKTSENLLNAVDYIGTFRVLGGEPFLHPDMYIIINKLKMSNKIGRLEVVTNGTIIPKGKNIECLKGENLFVRVSNYGEISTNKDKLIETMENAGIKYNIHDCLKNKWGDLGEPLDRERTAEESEEIYSNCTARGIPLIFDGNIYVCGRQPHSIKMRFSPADDFFIDVLNGDESSIRNGLENIKNVKQLKACNYCDGRRLSKSYKEIESAIQFADCEMKEFRQRL